METVKHHWCNGFNQLSPNEWEMYLSVSAPSEEVAYEWVRNEYEHITRWMYVHTQTVVQPSHYNYMDNGLNIYSFRLIRTLV